MSQNSQFSNQIDYKTIIKHNKKNRLNSSKYNLYLGETFNQKQDNQTNKQSPKFNDTYSHIITVNNPQYFFKVNTTDCQLIKVLLKQNQNLKHQNIVFQRELNKFKLKQKDSSETILEYQTIISALNAHNIKLHNQILQFSQNANNKVDKLKTTISNFLKNKPQQQSYYKTNETFSMSPSFENLETIKTFKRNQSEKGFFNIGRQGRIQSKVLKNNGSISELSISQNDGQFSVLLEQCKIQPNPYKRKQIRKRLTQLAYRQ